MAKTVAKKTAKRTTKTPTTTKTPSVIARAVIGTGGGGGGGGGGPIEVAFSSELVEGVQVDNNVRVGTNALIRLTAIVTKNVPTITFSVKWTLQHTPPGGSPLTRTLTKSDDGTTFVAEFRANDEGLYHVDFEVKRATNVLWAQWFEVSAVPVSTLQQSSGHLTFLRVHQDSGFGPPTDHIDGDVIIKLDTRPDMAFGLPLLPDARQNQHRGQLDLLRSAFEHNFLVTIDYNILDGRRHGNITRVALSK